DQPMGELLDWLKVNDCPPNLSKAIPTEILFFWNPRLYFFIKPTQTDRFFRLIGVEPLGKGTFLTSSTYRQVLARCGELKAELVEWSPRDMIDLQSFVFSVADSYGSMKPGATGSHQKASTTPSI